MNKEYVLAMFTIKDLRSEFVTAPAIPPPPLPPRPMFAPQFQAFLLMFKVEQRRTSLCWSFRNVYVIIQTFVKIFL